MYPILFSIGRVHIYTHGVMIVLGIILGSVLLYLMAQKKGFETDFLFDTIVYSIFAGLIGARLAYIILYHNQFANFKEMLFIWYGGLTSFGGIICGFLVSWAILHYKKKPVGEWFDIGIIGFLVGWAVGRVGCLLAGDSLGIVSASKIAIWGRLPSQLFESIWAIILAAVCYFIYLKKSKWNLPDGFIFLAGVSGYAIGRFAIDFFRDEPLILNFLKASQIFSLLIFIIAAFIMGVMIKRLRTNSPRREF